MHRSRRLRIALGLNAALVVTQVVVGIVAHSIGLVADAGHNLTDVAAVTLAIFAVHLTNRPGDDRRSFGYHRSTILAAQANAAALLVVMALIVYEAINRLVHPQSIEAGPVIVVAIVATVINLLSARILDDHSHDLNMRAALLHMTSDALTSAGVAVAAIVIATTGGNDWLDPVVSLVIALVIAVRAVQLLGAATHVLLESTPADVDPARAGRRDDRGRRRRSRARSPHLEPVVRLPGALGAHRPRGRTVARPGTTRLRRGEGRRRLTVRDRHATLEPEARHCAPDAIDPCRIEPRVGA